MIKRSFLVAGLITFVVFAAGMAVQWNLDKARTDNIVTSINDLRLATNSVLTERELANLFEGDECLAYRERTSTIANQIGELGNRLETYDRNDIFAGGNFDQLRHEYHILQIFYWTRLLQIKEECDASDFVTILYFYEKGEDCPVCTDQGTILTSIKNKYGQQTQIFSLDLEMQKEESTVGFLVEKYNITETPTIIIDKNDKIEGFISKKDLENRINEKLEE